MNSPETWVDEPALGTRANQIKSTMAHISQIEARTDHPYLVKRWLSPASASVAFGPSNVGKSFWALDLGLHVAANRDWHGRRVNGGTVVFAALEGGLGFANRIEAVRRRNPDLVANADFHLLKAPLNLANPDDANALAEAVTNLNPVLIVIDTLARAMQGDENSTQDMGKLVRNIDLIRKRVGAHVMLIHHTGKVTANGARGSSALKAAVDTEIELKRVGDTITAQAEKQRDMETGSLFAYELRGVEIGLDQDGEQITSAVVEETEAPNRKPKISGQALIAYQALIDVIADHGEKRRGDKFPSNRLCVSVERWKIECKGRRLSNGTDPSAERKAFDRAMKTLHEKLTAIRIVDDLVWIVSNE
jgi:hypothetical protein